MKPKIIAIIHARGGSKRIPLKNLKPLAGKPLIWYPVRLAKAVPAISRVIVSSDHPEILRLAREAGAETPFVRPADISEDVPSEMVNQHCLKWLKDNEGYEPDFTVMLTPANPLTKPSDLNHGFKLMLEHPEWDSVITVRKAKEFPQWMIDVLPDGTGKSLLGNNFDGDNNVSQKLKKYSYPLGAFYINRVSSFLKNPSMYGERYGCVELDPAQHVDIDYPEDLVEAEEKIKGSGLLSQL